MKAWAIQNNNKLIKKVKTTHEKKLRNLGITNDLLPIDPSKVIFNYSNKVLSDREKQLLSLGLDFKLPHFKLNFYKYFLPFEDLYNFLENLDAVDAPGPPLKFHIQNIAQRWFYNFKTHKVFSPFINKSDYILLRNLAKDESIIICKPDKGIGVVIMNKTDYVEKMEEILNDITKFKELNYEDSFTVIIKIEDKINRFIRKLKDSGTISEETSRFLLVSGSSPGILHGLPKVHKANIPTRPISSACGTANYNIAKFLVPKLMHLTENEYTVKNSYIFAQNIRSYRNSSKYCMCSFDITSLFTNIPLNETIGICLDQIYKDENKVDNLTRTEFKTLLQLAVKDAHFLFNGKLYQQIDGLAMGSPLAPTSANLFLCLLPKPGLEAA